MVILTKEQLVEDLKMAFKELTDWTNEQPEDHFNKEIIPEKWTIAGHVYHLIKSTKAVSQGMLIPKASLETMFGKSNRPERSFNELMHKYKQTLIENKVKAPKTYEAEASRVFERNTLLKRFNEELTDLVKAIELWDEKEMTDYIMPHPAIGKCTIREFIYFSTFHTTHHLAILKKQYV